MGDQDIRLIGTSWKVSATDTVSKDEYEPFKAHQSIEGEIPVDVGELDGDARRDLKARLLTIQQTAHEVVKRSTENRMAAPGHEDWGVYNGDPDDGGGADG